MNTSEIHGQLKKLFDEYDLGQLVDEPKPISGGLIHKVYQACTKDRKYAVKALNPSIMLRDGVFENMVNSERIAVAFSKIVPAVTALQFKNQSVLFMDGYYYMIFEWFDGESIFPPLITQNECRKIGQLLGKIHNANIRVPNISKKLSKSDVFDWESCLVKGENINAPWVSLYSSKIEKLLNWNQQANDAKLQLSNLTVLSHRDLDPKNVLWRNGDLYIIDWEAAGYVNPHQELLEVLNYWADKGNGQLDKNKFDVIYDEYAKITGISNINWEPIFAHSFIGTLGWMNYSLKRSLGMDNVSIDERKIGSEQVFGTLNSLETYADQIDMLKLWLDEQKHIHS